MKIMLMLFMTLFATVFGGIEKYFKPAEGKTEISRMRNIDFIYLLNLDPRPEKFKLCTDQLHPYGIFPYRFSAINGWEDLTVEMVNDVGVVLEPWMRRGFWGTCYLPGEEWQPHHEIIHRIGRNYFCHCMSRGAIAIALSHLSILQDAYDSGYNTIWVMEDDIEVIRNPHELSQLVEQLDKTVGCKNWDVLFTDRDTKNQRGEHVACTGYAQRPDFSPENPQQCLMRMRTGSLFERIGARYGAYSMIVRRSGIMSNVLPTQFNNIPLGENTGVVLGVKTVDLRGDLYPYNGAIIKNGKEGYRLFFRYDLLDGAARNGIFTHIGCVEIDSDFRQTEKEFVPIDLNSRYAEDPRVLQIQDRLFLIYNDLLQSDYVSNNRIMCMGEFSADNLKLQQTYRFDPCRQPIEKNWAPFVYAGPEGESDIYFEYMLAPRKLFKVLHWGEATLTHLFPSSHKNAGSCYWPKIWGELHGGSAAQEVDGQYLAFFHSSFQDKEDIMWYCLGAYTFETAPPFRMTGISHYPILFEGIYSTPPLHTADPKKRVIFPAGFVIEQRGGREVIQLSCGENDASVKVITLDKKQLLKGLKKINP